MARAPRAGGSMTRTPGARLGRTSTWTWSGPTLVVTGVRDTTVTPARQRLLVDGIPRARQLVVPQAGHAVPVDQAEIFNQALIGFLKE